MGRMPELPGVDKGSPVEPESDSDDMVEVHAKALIGALGRKDPKAVANAFRAMKSACEEEYGGPPDDILG